MVERIGGAKSGHLFRQVNRRITKIVTKAILRGGFCIWSLGFKGCLSKSTQTGVSLIFTYIYAIFVDIKKRMILLRGTDTGQGKESPH